MPRSFGVCTLTACGSGGQESTPEGESAAKDTLTIATQADMGDKDPINGITTNDTIKIKAQVYETLIERTVPEQEYKPLLAESWEFNDDATELTITLREGITTHNGETLSLRGLPLLPGPAARERQQVRHRPHGSGKQLRCG